MVGVLKYMSKIRKIIIILLLLCIVGVWYLNKQNVGYIKDISKYEGLTQEVDKIEVRYDNDTGSYVGFIIDDKNELNEIMSIILNTKLEKSEPWNGNNTVLIIYKGLKTYSMNVVHVGTKNQWYEFETYELTDKITKIYESRYQN